MGLSVCPVSERFGAGLIVSLSEAECVLSKLTSADVLPEEWNEPGCVYVCMYVCMCCCFLVCV